MNCLKNTEATGKQFVNKMNDDILLKETMKHQPTYHKKSVVTNTEYECNSRFKENSSRLSSTEQIRECCIFKVIF